MRFPLLVFVFISCMRMVILSYEFMKCLTPMLVESAEAMGTWHCSGYMVVLELPV